MTCHATFLWKVLWLAALGIAEINAWGGSVKNLVTFGDSLTDEGRLLYFGSHNGTAPPAGSVFRDANVTSTGGFAWPHFASQALGARTFNYAVAGAMCSNDIISRYLAPIHQDFPSVKEYEIPAFLADVEYFETHDIEIGSATWASLSPETVYALWIGGNDLGSDGFLRDRQSPGKTIQDYVECVWGVFDSLYEQASGRRFVLFLQVPLEQSPLYASLENGGFGDSQFWADKTAYNTTEYEQKALEYTTLVGTIGGYGVPFQKLVENRWPDAEFSVFDVHSLLRDIHAHPEEYLDAPADVTGVYHRCTLSNSTEGATTCVDSENPLSSFLWYDELHPSERADEIIAEELVRVIYDNSSYGVTY